MRICIFFDQGKINIIAHFNDVVLRGKLVGEFAVFEQHCSIKQYGKLSG